MAEGKLRNTMDTEHTPDGWKTSTLILTFKNKGDIQDTENMERIDDQRLRSTLEKLEQQFGRMPNRNTLDAIFALYQLIEKCRGGQEDLVNLEKAYDRVPHHEG